MSDHDEKEQQVFLDGKTTTWYGLIHDNVIKHSVKKYKKFYLRHSFAVRLLWSFFAPLTLRGILESAKTFV